MTDPDVHSGITRSRLRGSTELGSPRPVHTYYSVLAGVSSAHMFNDMMQAPDLRPIEAGCVAAVRECDWMRSIRRSSPSALLLALIATSSGCLLALTAG